MDSPQAAGAPLVTQVLPWGACCPPGRAGMGAPDRRSTPQHTHMCKALTPQHQGAGAKEDPRRGATGGMGTTHRAQEVGNRGPTPRTKPLTACDASPRCPDGQSEAQPRVGIQAPAQQGTKGMMTAGPAQGRAQGQGARPSWLPCPGSPQGAVLGLVGCPAPGSPRGAVLGREGGASPRALGRDSLLRADLAPPAPNRVRLLNRLLQSRVRGPRAPHIGS